jgi:hypothetical protein
VVPPTAAQALEEIGNALIDLGRGIRLLSAAIATDAQPAQDATLDDYELEQLWRRLGPGNRYLLMACAERFQPGQLFDLDEMAEAAGASTGTVRARLMNIGRSLKSMGNDFTVLWDNQAGLLGAMYEWREGAHRFVREKSSK